MISYYGDFAEDDTVNIPFNTFDSNDPSASVTITNLADADIKVHKDGSITQIVTDGATVVVDFDGITGNHMITIDTSAHADYAVGSEYAVRIEGTTVDAATVNAWVGAFSIERAGGTLALIKAGNLSSNVVQISGDATAADNLELDYDGTGLARANSTIGTCTTNTDMVGTTGAALATVCTEARLAELDAANLPADIDAILLDTGTTLDAAIAVVDANVDQIETAVITNAAGVDIAADIIALDTVADAIKVITDQIVFTVANQIDANMLAISGDATAADRLEAMMDGIIIAQVADASATTTAFAADGFTEATDDHFNGRLITFITGALTAQQTDITDYDAAGGPQGAQELTVTALTEAPANNDFFVIH